MDFTIVSAVGDARFSQMIDHHFNDIMYEKSFYKNVLYNVTFE